jgi:O-antigen/teichoic acid export membrane protein
MSLATMIAGILLPYLAADWESGRRDLVKLRLRQTLFAITTLFTAGAAVALLLAPCLFRKVLQDRYADGLTLMPMAFVFAIWIALAVIGQNYLWVAEKGKLVAVAIGAGLATNIALNFLLLPIWGLYGAVVATTIANGIVLVGLWIAMARHGYPLDSTALSLTLLPVSLLLNPITALALAMLLPLANPQARDWLAEWIEIGLAKAKLRKIVTS